jgi:alginate O-acetyltransferase complex protein AlgI
VAITWVFFRAHHVGQALQIIKNIFTCKDGSLFIGNASYLVYGILLITFLVMADYQTEKLGNRFSLLYSSNKTFRWIAYCLLIMSILLLGVFNGGQFIYFQF